MNFDGVEITVFVFAATVPVILVSSLFLINSTSELLLLDTISGYLEIKYSIFNFLEEVIIVEGLKGLLYSHSVLTTTVFAFSSY